MEFKLGGQILKNARQISEFGRQIFLKAQLKIPLQNLRSKYVDMKISWKNIEILLS